MGLAAKPDPFTPKRTFNKRHYSLLKCKPYNHAPSYVSTSHTFVSVLTSSYNKPPRHCPPPVSLGRLFGFSPGLGKIFVHIPTHTNQGFLNGHNKPDSWRD